MATVVSNKHEWGLSPFLCYRLNFRPPAHMPGPHNHKRKKRAQKKKQHANSKTHTNTSSVVTVQSTCSAPASSPTPVSLLTSTTPDVHGVESLPSDHRERDPRPGHDTHSPPGSPLAYGPTDDPT